MTNQAAPPPLRALVVEDDFAVAKLHGVIVDAHPAYRLISTAHTGKAALEAVERLRPDVMLLDVYLPDISGLEVLARIRGVPTSADERSRASAARPMISVIALTAARDLDSVRQARMGGIVHYLVKPFRAAELTRRLDDLARQHRLLRQAERSGVDQAMIDSIMTGTHRQLSGLPKGLGAVTLTLIETTLQAADEPASAEEIAQAAQLSRVSARRYLDYLCQIGRASVTPQYGRAGRPELRYAAIGARSAD